MHTMYLIYASISLTAFLHFLVSCFVTAILICLLLFLHHKYRKYVISHIRYERHFTKEGVFEGEQTELVELIHNPTFLPILFVDAEYYLYSALQLKNRKYTEAKELGHCISRFSLLPFMKVKRVHTVICRKRGKYTLESAAIYDRSTPYFFDTRATVCVYPKYIDVKDNSLCIGTLQGNDKSIHRLINDPFIRSGVRDYRTGDPMSSINFKASARNAINSISDIKVNMPDYCSARSTVFILNFQTLAEQKMTTPDYTARMEDALSYVASLCCDYTYNGYRFAFLANCVTKDGSNSVSISLDGGSAHLKALLEELSTVNTQSGISIYSLIEENLIGNVYQSEIIFITTYMDERITSLLEILRADGNNPNVFTLESRKDRKAMEAE